MIAAALDQSELVNVNRERSYVDGCCCAQVGRLELQYRLEEFLKEEFQRHVAEVGGVDRWMLKQSK